MDSGSPQNPAYKSPRPPLPPSRLCGALLGHGRDRAAAREPAHRLSSRSADGRPLAVGPAVRAWRAGGGPPAALQPALAGGGGAAAGGGEAKRLLRSSLHDRLVAGIPPGLAERRSTVALVAMQPHRLRRLVDADGLRGRISERSTSAVGSPGVRPLCRSWPVAYPTSPPCTGAGDGEVLRRSSTLEETSRELPPFVELPAHSPHPRCGASGAHTSTGKISLGRGLRSSSARAARGRLLFRSLHSPGVRAPQVLSAPRDLLWGRPLAAAPG